MKKAFILLSIIVFSMALAFADDSRFYTLNATTNVGTGSSQYRFNYTTVYDLSDYFTGQRGTTPIYDDYSGSQNNYTGTLNQSRALGTVGVAACEHKIKYTISTTNNGRFVSQSDPSKYREYYVVIVPDKGNANGTSRTFYYPGNDTKNSYAPNSKNGPIEFETVVTRTTTSSWGWGGLYHD